MAKNYHISTYAANVEANALAPEFDSGYLRLYSATDVLLAELRFGDPAFASAIDGVLTSNAIVADFDAKATGVISKFKTFRVDGATELSNGTVGTTADFDMRLNSVSVQKGAKVEITSFKHTVVK